VQNFHSTEASEPRTGEMFKKTFLFLKVTLKNIILSMSVVMGCGRRGW
jgi:hypothetical protein